jgi:actin-related protein
MATESISDIRRDLFSSIVVSGGNAMYKHMVDRLNR